MLSYNTSPGQGVPERLRLTTLGKAISTGNRAPKAQTTSLLNVNFREYKGLPGSDPKKAL